MSKKTKRSKRTDFQAVRYDVRNLDARPVVATKHATQRSARGKRRARRTKKAATSKAAPEPAPAGADVIDLAAARAARGPCTDPACRRCWGYIFVPRGYRGLW